ncbi:unnamed protein product [Amaranthus hypochondriacus]
MDWICSSINITWKLCFLGSFLGCLTLLIFLDQNGKIIIFSSTNTVQQFSSYPESHPPSHTASSAGPAAADGYSEAPVPSMIGLAPEQDYPIVDAPEAPRPSMIGMAPEQDAPEAPLPSMIGLAPKQDYPLVDAPEAPLPSQSMIGMAPEQDAPEAPLPSMNGMVPVQEDPFIDASEAPPLPSKSIIIINNDNDVANLSNMPLKRELPNPTNKSGDEIKCNMFDGRWVYKPEVSLIYDSFNCPIIEEKMRCRKNGRPDFDYEKWIWEAEGCDIPLFDGKQMLDRLRNKRMIIVGDSLNRNMWESLVCLLYSSIRSSRRVEVQSKNPHYKVLKAKDYNALIEFHWSPFLIEYDPNHKSGRKVLILDKLSSNSKLWKGADVMVFNSAHWWKHTGTLKKWDTLLYKGKMLEGIPLERAYEIGMKTWAQWIHKNVDANKTTVFFRSVSAQHNGKPHCYDVTQPIKSLSDSPYKNNFPMSLINIIENIISGMSKPQVKYLNITKLSEYRIDAHPSLYRTWEWKMYTKNQSLIRSFTDCSHWCLPGLPDTWNRLLYASLFFDF